MDSSVSPYHFVQFHQRGQSPYSYKFAEQEIHWLDNDSYVQVQLMKQVDTLNMNKYSYICNQDNQNHFMSCMENYYSKRLGCFLPWSSEYVPKNRTGNVCKGKDKFMEYKNISMNILKPVETQELIRDGCFIPNCQQRSWRTKKEKWSGKYGFEFSLPQNPNVSARKEVKLYTLVNFFAEVGGYLGLLLGESLISYIITVSQWVRLIGQKMKEKCRKVDKEPN